MKNSRTYLDPQTLAKLKGLELQARMIVEGLVAGQHKSPFQGFSVEFAEHREYVPGDDLRYVDWKLAGKTDRFFLKMFEEETNFACHLLLDASESMRYRSASAAVSKWEYAQYIAAALAHLILRQQDAVGLTTFDSQVTAFLPASSQPSHLKALFRQMEEAPTAGKTSLERVLHDVAERIRHRGLVILISDLFDDVDSLMLGLKHLHYRRHDVSVLQIIDPAEQDFAFQEPQLFAGMEDAQELAVDPKSLRRAYRREFDQFLSAVRGGCRGLNIDHVLIRSDQPVDLALRRFLIDRMHRLRRV